MSPKIYLVAFESDAFGHGYSGQAIAEDGSELCGHFSSTMHFAKHDMGLTSDWKHDIYAKHYPDGYELEWVDDPDAHAGFLAAVELNRRGKRSMSLIEECKKLRELEQQATCAPWYKAERDEGDCDEINGRIQSWDTGVMVYDRELGVFHPEQVKIRCGPEEFEDDYSMESICSPDKEANARFIAESRNLASAMLEVLGCIREGDAERLGRAAERLRVESVGWMAEDRAAAKEDIAAYRRLQKAVALMEQEGEG